MKSVLIFFLLASTNVFSGTQEREADGYDIGTELSICAGDFYFASLLFKAYKQDATSKSLKELSNGWMLAGVSNYYFSGLTYELSKVSSEGKKETTSSQWMARLEGVNKDDEKLGVLVKNLTNKLELCKEYEDTVVLSQKLLKQFLSKVTTK